MVGPFCDALEGGVAAVARTIDRGAVDPNVDKHALASAASQLWPWCCWYTARTTSIGTLLTREIPTHLTVVGLATVPEGGPTAVAVPLVVHILKFVKHGLAFAATARLAKHLAMYCHCTAPVTVTVTPRAQPPREPHAPTARVAHGRPKVAEDDKQHLACICKCTCHALGLPHQCPTLDHPHTCHHK